jgi:hypothetical protein
MPFRRLFLGAALAAACLAGLRAEPAHMPVDEIRPGMVGTGRTVFAADRIEEFKVQVIGVLRNVIGPRRSLVLAKLEGGPLADTGVIAGMSGSPVYIDGRLVGAVSYSLGTFTKEAIAGITPIDEMVEATSRPSPRSPATMRAALDLPLTGDELAEAVVRSFGGSRPFATSPADVQVLAAAPGIGPETGALLRPIATPLLLGGFEPDVADLVTRAFRAGGFAPLGAGAGGGRADVPPTTRPLEPGDAVGVSLMDGDLSLGGTGTVTSIDGTRVYAFGHPFYNLGPTTFPMTRAYVHTVLSSLMSSSKLASLGETIGTFEQDRATAIAGTLGARAALLPISLTLETDRGPKRTFQFQVVRDQLFTPLLAYVSILNTLKSYERENGAASFGVRGRALVRDHGEVAFEDLFTGDQPSAGAAGYVATPLTLLLKNDFEPVEIDGLDLSITSLEEPRTATIERVWLDTVDVRPGRTVPLKVMLRSYRGEEVTRDVPVEIPANASGTLTVVVADGTRLTQLEQREARQLQQARGVAQIVRAFNKAKKNNRLYVRLLSPDLGAVVSGEPLPALPPSVLAVFDADRSSGQVTPLRNATLGEWDFPTDYAVSGARFLTIAVDDN